jgi:hypothetical protein
MDNEMSLEEAALRLWFVTEVESGQVVDPSKTVRLCVADSAAASMATHV